MSEVSKTTPRPIGLVSVVIPVKDERDNVADLADALAAALSTAPWDWECVWVDDGSTDGTTQAIVELSGRSSRHSFVQLDRCYGQSAALATGFKYARGDVVATLDGDGQNPPQEIPGLVERLLEDDVDMVCGYRRRRYSVVRSVSSRIANGFRNLVTGDRIRDVGCSLRVFRAECVDGLFVFRGMHRFLPTLVRLNGYNRIVEVPVDHGPRRKGRTKYGIGNRLWVGIADTIAVRWMSRRAVRARVRTSSVEPSVVQLHVHDRHITPLVEEIEQ